MDRKFIFLELHLLLEHDIHKMKKILFFLLLFLSLFAAAKVNKPEDFGFKHIGLSFNNDSIDVLVLSKKGEEERLKPLFFFCQGSLPIPLIITEGEMSYPSFPFDTKKLCEKYHLVIVGKPGIPLIFESKNLQPDFSYVEDYSYLPPKKYILNNHLDYYVQRNLHVLDYFINQKYIDRKTVIVAGHSQGARVACEMTLQSQSITHLIYASGNPCGQIMAMVSASRQRENPIDTLSPAENDLLYFQEVVADSNNIQLINGETNKSIYSFSKSSLTTFPSLNIPVLICYGTLDTSAPFNDLLRVEVIKQRKSNFTFKSYIGLDHNYFGTDKNGQIDYENFNWDRVANDWANWLESLQ